jgi:predicted nucleotide-binding protein (sugar kinase/HSP70/actin superfamily)
LVSLGEPLLVPRQLHESLRDIIEGLTLTETSNAVEQGYRTLDCFNQQMRARSRSILEWCAREDHPCIMVLARPYHMDSGIGHEIEADLQAHGYPILWLQYVPSDGHISSPFDIRDVWTSSYSANTNELLWGAKVAARIPWISCAIRLTSYECGMDQPTFSPVLQIVERSGTLFFSFQELDSTKPAGSVKIRVETIAHYLERNSRRIIEQKKLAMRAPFPLKEASRAAS